MWFSLMRRWPNASVQENHQRKNSVTQSMRQAISLAAAVAGIDRMRKVTAV